MERNCFLCREPVEVLERARWHLPGLPAQELGFGVCRGCGLVLQSPVVEPDELAHWYASAAVYTGPGRGGEPHPRKVRGTTRFLNMVAHALDGIPARVFQVGASDGYSLARFREAGASVHGVEPGAASRELARRRHGVELAAGTIEEHDDPPAADLWVLTHVLEHLYDPLATLARARAAPGKPCVAIEVPLFERPELWPPGYLSFEHLTYFTEPALERVLAAAGFEVVSLAKEYADDIYPVVAAVGRPVDVAPAAAATDRRGDRDEARERLLEYLERERDAWRAVDEHLVRQLAPGSRVHLFGAGVHASQLLANTSLARHANVVAALDSSPQKHGTTLGDLAVRSPDDVALGAGDAVVIASFASEGEIWDRLAPERERGVRVVRPHGARGNRRAPG